MAIARNATYYFCSASWFAVGRKVGDVWQLALEDKHFGVPTLETKGHPGTEPSLTIHIHPIINYQVEINI